MTDALQTRKPLRLKEYDYSRTGYYYVTVCTREKRCMLGSCVGRDDHGAPHIALSPCGEIVKKYLLSIDGAYDNIKLDKYVIMPNHVHMILRVEASSSGAPGSSRPTNDRGGAHGAPGSSRPTQISGVVGCIKRFANREAGEKLWQTSFYDHVIRNDEDYRRIWQYIDDNPAKWAEDEYYAE